MSYIALARKWRPRTFSELLGQNHITNALIHSLDRQRMHHAYLFTGTRGVGKTSVARLLAKALNCEQGVSSLPCLQCDTCLAIEQGCFIDLIEIDGASRTRVEDTRELLENVQYVPTNGRFKIYLIDEVHMLSQHSFNALLKTLEEPPAHVKFILATTDPQKLPVTVLSRCLQFSLKHISEEIISQHLEYILKEESITYDVSALALIAKAARGSIRDALSLLDQAIASCRESIDTQPVKEMLGYTQQDYALFLLRALQAQNPQELISLCRQIGHDGGQFCYVLDELLSYLHKMALNQTLLVPNALIDIHPDIQQLSQQFTPEDVQLMYQIALKGAQDIKVAPTMAIGFEMTILRMFTFRPVSIDASSFAPTQIDAAPSMKTPSSPSLAESHPVPTESHSSHIQEKTTEPNLVSPTWDSILPQLHLKGLTLSAAENAQLLSKKDHQIVLSVEKAHQSLFTPSVLERIEKALSDFYDENIKLTLAYQDHVTSSPAVQKKNIQEKKHQDAKNNLLSDPFFQQLQDEFSGELLKESIAPREGESF